MSRSGRLAVAVVVLAAATAAMTAQQTSTQKPAQPTFRSVVTMVPIDVRVLDGNGDPITDLKAGDFTILENGKRQQIGHFSTMALTAETREPGTTPAFEQVLGPGTGGLTSQNRRVFLILLGRGRIIGPVKEIEALVDFVRTRLLPQDLVAVQAYNRATPFTSDHPAVAQLLEQVRERNGLIERDLENWFGGLRAVYGSPGIPPAIQQQIDGLFASVPALSARSTMARPIEHILRDIRATADQLQRGNELAARPDVNGQPAGLPDSVATATAERLEMTLDEYAAQQADVRQDSTNLFAGINYLRQLEGEKHLVFVTPRGISLPRMEQNQSLVAAAADGRVAVSIIFTGGPAVAPRPVDLGPDRVIGSSNMPAPFASASRAFQQTFAISDLREMTEITGGQLSVYRDGSEAVDRIDRATRFHYLLGYDSTNATLDGRFRDITIRVNRRGATVLHRRGYFASERLIPPDRRAFMTATRVAEAGAFEHDIDDIVVDIKKTTVEGRGDARQLVVELQVRAPNLRLAEQGDRRVGAIELAVFVADGRQRGVGQLRQTIDVRLRPESVERFLAEGTTLTTRVPFDGEALFLKVIAYDYGSDLVGTATRTLR